MFSCWTGSYKGASITVVSGGSGGAEAELALHELLENTPATAYVRVGGSGGLHASVRPGDVVISSGVVRDEGMTRSYIPASYPASCSFEVVAALAEAASGRRHAGMSESLGQLTATSVVWAGQEWGGICSPGISR